MRIALAQMSVEEGAVERNLRVAGTMARKAVSAGADVVAFPELFVCGYDGPYLRSLDRKGTIEVERAVRSMAREITVVAGSIAERRGRSLFNTTLVVNSGGTVAARYRKVHLFGPMGEDKVFSPGARTVGFKIAGRRAGLATCYDLRFPEIFRRLAYRHRASVIFVQSSWPMPRRLPWDLLLRARAIENQLFVCGTNRVGRGGSFEYFGSTQVVDPTGEVIGTKGQDEGLLVVDVDLSKVDTARAALPALRDRRPSVYGRY